MEKFNVKFVNIEDLELTKRTSRDDFEFEADYEISQKDVELSSVSNKLKISVNQGGLDVSVKIDNTLYTIPNPKQFLDYVIASAIDMFGVDYVNSVEISKLRTNIKPKQF